MTASEKYLKILDSLLHHDEIRAALWVDPNGKIKARRGHALSLKQNDDDPTVPFNIRKSPGDGPPESLYIRQFVGNDFLVVIFDDDAKFDAVKDNVDTLTDRGL